MAGILHDTSDGIVRQAVFRAERLELLLHRVEKAQSFPGACPHTLAAVPEKNSDIVRTKPVRITGIMNELSGAPFQYVNAIAGCDPQVLLAILGNGGYIIIKDGMGEGTIIVIEHVFFPVQPVHSSRQSAYP